MTQFRQSENILEEKKALDFELNRAKEQLALVSKEYSILFQPNRIAYFNVLL